MMFQGQPPSFSSSGSKRKRGPSRGPSPSLDGSKKRVNTNEYGQPNSGEIDYTSLASAIGCLTRTHIPIIYKTILDVPNSHMQKVKDLLQVSFDLELVSSEYLEDRMKSAFRNHKCKLNGKYVKGKDPTIVKAGPTPSFVTREDWVQFVDHCNSDAFKAQSRKNSANRGKLVAVSTLGRRSMAVVRNELAKEQKCKSDAEVGRSEVFIKAHTKKDNTVQCPEVIKKLKDLSSSNPESLMTGVDDALSQTIGKDSRGRVRGLGGGICMTVLKKTGYLLKKNEVLQMKNAELTSTIVEIKSDVDKIKATIGDTPLSRRGENSTSSGPVSPSIQSYSTSTTDIGKQCDIYSWSRDLVARGEVQAVDPTSIVHNVPMGNGNYKVSINEILVSDSGLYKPDGYSRSIGEVGVGGYVVWSRDFLDIA